MTKAPLKVEQPISPQLGPPPLPKEHGAWVILYAPMVLGLVAAARNDLVAGLLTFATVTSIFLGREAASLLIRGRSTPQIRRWAGIYALAATIFGVMLLASSVVIPLVVVGLLALSLFGIHSALLRFSGRRRLDRSQWGEIVGVAALTLTAPAAYVAATGHIDGKIALLWLACVAYYSSGVFYVKMWLAAVKMKKSWDSAAKLKCGIQNNLYNGFLAAAVIIASLQFHSVPARLLLCLAYLPAIIRSAWGYRQLSPKLPPLKRVGLQETCYSVWFTLMLVAITHLAAV